MEQPARRPSVTPPAAWLAVWGALLGLVLTAEAWSLLDRRRGDTLSEVVWWLVDLGWPGALAAAACGVVCGHWFHDAGPALLGPRSYLLLPPLVAGVALLAASGRRAPCLLVFLSFVFLGAALWRRRIEAGVGL